MPEDSETVADVLGELDRADCYALRKVAEGETDGLPDLSYEEWVRPMKLTGGRVCLRFDADDLPGLLYVQRTSNGNMWAYETVAANKRSIQSGEVRFHLDDDVTAVDPVLREDTPFAEGP